MAAAADWKKELGEAGLPTKAQETLLKMGYITKVSFVKAFKTLDALEPFLKKLLLEDKVAGDVKPEFWEWHPVSGVLRGLWEADAKAAGVLIPLLQRRQVCSAWWGAQNWKQGSSGICGRSLQQTIHRSGWMSTPGHADKSCSMCGNSSGRRTSASSHGSIYSVSHSGRDQRKRLRKRRSPCLGS